MLNTRNVCNHRPVDSFASHVPDRIADHDFARVFTGRIRSGPMNSLLRPFPLTFDLGPRANASNGDQTEKAEHYSTWT
jgi:hypothetical protein